MQKKVFMGLLLVMVIGLPLQLSSQPNQRQPTLTVLWPTHDTMAVNITALVYVEIASPTENTKRCKKLMFDNRTESSMILAIGAVGKEVDRYRVPSTGIVNMIVHIPAGVRVSLKAIGSKAKRGVIAIDCYY